MKRFIVIILACFAFISAHAQFANTKWKGTLMLDTPTEVMFDFKTDTVEAITVADGQSLETMKFAVQDTVLTLQKIMGQSQCDESYVAKYKFEIKDNEVLLTAIEDSCPHRSDVLNNTRWKKEE